MATYEEMSSYVNDNSRHAVCGEMSEIIGNKDTSTREKLVFSSFEEATKKALEVKVASEQAPYLCQFCQFWHLGHNSRFGKAELNFVLPYRSKYRVREEVKSDRPLYVEIENLKPVKFNLNHKDSMLLKKLADKNQLNHYNVFSLATISITPQYRAIAWAIHDPSQRQPLILRTNNGFAYRSRAGEYWEEDFYF